MWTKGAPHRKNVYLCVALWAQVPACVHGKPLDSVSLISYYFNVVTTYVSYYWVYYQEEFHSYPIEARIAIGIIQWSFILIVALILLVEKKGHHRRQKDRVKAKLEERFGEAMDHVFTREHTWAMSRDEITALFHVDEQKVAD